MSHKDFIKKRREFQDDLSARQRNIVFPDTVRNEGMFFRELADGKRSLNRIQRIGVLILAAVSIIFGTIPFMSAVDGWRGASEHKFMNAYKGFGAPGLFTFLGLLLMLLGAKLLKAAIAARKPLKRQSLLRPRV